MKESEYYQRMADDEENDFKFWALQSKVERAKRNEAFEDFHLEKVRNSEKVLEVVQLPNLYKIRFLNGMVLDFYPKKNRACVLTQKNTWVSNGLAFILNKI